MVHSWPHLVIFHDDLCVDIAVAKLAVRLAHEVLDLTREKNLGVNANVTGRLLASPLPIVLGYHDPEELPYWLFYPERVTYGESQLISVFLSNDAL